MNLEKYNNNGRVGHTPQGKDCDLVSRKHILSKDANFRRYLGSSPSLLCSNEHEYMG